MRDESLCGCSCHAVTPGRYISLCLPAFLINSKWNCKQMKQFYTKCTPYESRWRKPAPVDTCVSKKTYTYKNHNLPSRNVVLIDQIHASKYVVLVRRRWQGIYDLRLSYTARHDRVFSCALIVPFLQAFKGWVSVSVPVGSFVWGEYGGHRRLMWQEQGVVLPLYSTTSSLIHWSLITFLRKAPGRIICVATSCISSFKSNVPD